MHPRLGNAPIVEGLIDIQVRNRPGMTVGELGRFVSLQQSRYPTIKEMQDIQASIRVSEDGPNAKIEETKTGFRLERKEPPFVIMAKTLGLTVSRLRPYDTWEELETEAVQVWNSYRKVCEPEAVTRIATRFINRFELRNEPGFEFDHYLRAGPHVPPGLPQTVGEFMNRIVIPVGEDPTGPHIAITQVLESVSQDGTMVVLIDVDVSKFTALEGDAVEEIWPLLRTMRNLKNQAFFSSITEKTQELFK